MVILENIDIDKAILQNIDIDKISNRFKFGISNRANPLIIFIRRDFCSQNSFSILRILTILSRIIFPFPGFHFSPFFFHPCCLSSLVTGDKVISASSFVKTRLKCKYNWNLKIVMWCIPFFFLDK